MLGAHHQKIKISVFRSSKKKKKKKALMNLLLWIKWQAINVSDHLVKLAPSV